jgi:phosphoglucosamine mutase
VGDKSLFGTDGIRGTVGEFPLVPEFVHRLGTAAGAVLLQSVAHPTVVVGRDTRQSGQLLQFSLVAGLLSSDVTVIDVGVMTTPGVAYLVRKLGAEAGAVISASHNPVGENGIKLFDSEGFKLAEGIEQQIEDLALNTGLGRPRSPQPRSRCIDGSSMRELYIQDIVGEHRDLSLDQLTLVLDCANGAASWLAPECFARLGADVVAVHASPTGTNINSRAGSEYIRRHPEDLRTLVAQHRADFAVGFDGDADRTVLVDRDGSVVDGDHMLAILAQYLDQRKQLLGKTVVATSMRNYGLVEFIESAGLTFLETRVGDRYVVQKLLELARHDRTPGALALGGEQAGHIVLLDDRHGTGDGIRTALYLARALLESGAGSLAELASCIRKKPQVIASAAVSSKPSLDAIAELERLHGKVSSTLAGMHRIELRYSGTEPLFRAMLEADEPHSVQELADMAGALCRVVQQASGTADGDLEILNCTQGGTLSARPHPEYGIRWAGAQS